MKSERFEEELALIKNKIYRDNAKVLLDLLPDYFYKIPASATGKYHPKFAAGDGGLVRHTKVAVKIAYEMLQNKSVGHSFNDKEKDLILIALLLHDGLKKGKVEGEFTVHEHPLLAAEFIRENKDKVNFSKGEMGLLCDMIASHMGEWNQDPRKSDIVLPLPKNKYQRFVHMCDCLSSKKFINTEFSGDKIVV